MNGEKDISFLSYELCDSDLLLIKKYYYSRVDGFRVRKKSCKVIRDYDGAFCDLMVYEEGKFVIDVNRVFKVKKEIYDLIYKKDYKEEELKIKECSLCEFVLLKFRGGSNCALCKNKNNFQLDSNYKGRVGVS